MKIRRYNDSNYDSWEAFVKSSNNGTLFHSRQFLNYHPENRFQDYSLMLYKKDQLQSVFPAVSVLEKNKRMLISHPGASVGSLVLPENLSISRAIEIAKALVDFSKDRSFDGVRITIPPILYQKRMSNYMDYALIRHGFRYTKREITSILFLENDLNKNIKKFRPSHLRAVKKAKDSGVVVRQTQDFATFYKILHKNLSIRHNVAPTHTLNELLDLKNRIPDKINLFGAYLDNEMLAGVINFRINKNVILAFYISHLEDYQKLRPVNLLFYSIFDWAINEGVKVYDFGTFTVNEIPNLGLGRFKENFGASGIYRDTIELNLS